MQIRTLMFHTLLRISGRQLGAGCQPSEKQPFTGEVGNRSPHISAFQVPLDNGEPSLSPVFPECSWRREIPLEALGSKKRQ